MTFLTLMVIHLTILREEYIQLTSRDWTWNKKRVQGASSFCGLFYAILFLLYKARNNLHIFYVFFTRNYDKNDKKIEFLIKENLKD